MEVEKTAIPPKPDYTCHSCGGKEWWWRQNNWAIRGNWLCGGCHPTSNKDESEKK